MAVCQVPVCDRVAQRWAGDAHVCQMHAKRHEAHASFEPARRWSPPNSSPQVCAVDGCREMEDGASGHCKLHGTRLRRHGDAEYVTAPADRVVLAGDLNPRWSAVPSYSAAHQRVHRERGAASAQVCTDCGKGAAHWSYNRASEHELSSEKGPYSADVDDYVPRCVSCHKRFDLAAVHA